MYSIRRILVIVPLVLVLALAAGASLASASGPVASIIVQAGSKARPIFDAAGTDGVPPPEIIIVRPDGTLIIPH